MLRIYFNGKISEEREGCISKVSDIKVVYEYLNKKHKFTNIDVPKYCEEPMQHILRENGFTLQGM